MNRIFSPTGKGWPGFPNRAFARLDQTEPPNPRKAKEVLFVFDAVNADWNGFAPGRQFDLGNPQIIATTVAKFWDAMRAPPAQRQRTTPFDEMPIYRIEITARSGDHWWDKLMRITEADWMTLELANQGSFPVDVYGGILANAVKAFLLNAEKSPPKQRTALDKIYNLDDVENATTATIKRALSGVSEIKNLVAYDVGQGAAVGLVDKNENVRLFFDLGAGAYANKKTRPTSLRFCWRKDPVIVLSHWDTDHWAGETSDKLAAGKTWIAPRQTNLGPTHKAFVARIKAARGELHIWGAMPGNTLRHKLASGHTITFVRCTGRTRNGSGIAGLVEAPKGGAWLLTGDAGYHELAMKLPANLSAVVVPHHGADMGPKSKAPSAPKGYSRLIYSFGPGNTHGTTGIRHPTSAAVKHHRRRGWKHGAWSTNTPGCKAPGPNCHVLATAVNRRRATTSTHLDSAACGFTARPAVPFTTKPCAKSAKSKTGCTSKIVQA